MELRQTPGSPEVAVATPLLSQDFLLRGGTTHYEAAGTSAEDATPQPKNSNQQLDAMSPPYRHEIAMTPQGPPSVPESIRSCSLRETKEQCQISELQSPGQFAIGVLDDYVFNTGSRQASSTQALPSDDQSSPRESICQAKKPTISIDVCTQSEGQARPPMVDDPSVPTASPGVDSDGRVEHPLSSSDNTLSTSSVPKKRATKQASGKRAHQKRGRTPTVHGDADGDVDTKKTLEGKAFACPYYRKDPIRHFDCINRKLNRIQDLKQHLHRRHTAPHSCSVCSRGFSSSQLFEIHVRDKCCMPRTSGTNIDGVSPGAQELLKKRIDRKLSPRDQWYYIWKILFEDADTQQNPHLNGVVDEVLGIIRDFCEKDGHRVVSSFVQSRKLPADDVGILQPLLIELLDEVQSHIEQGPREPALIETPAVDPENNPNPTAAWNEWETILEPVPLVPHERNICYYPSFPSSESSIPSLAFSSLSSNTSEPDYALPSSYDFSFVSPPIDSLDRRVSADIVLADLSSDVYCSYFNLGDRICGGPLSISSAREPFMSLDPIADL